MEKRGLVPSLGFLRSTPRLYTLEAHAKKRPVFLRGALGFLGFRWFCCGERGAPTPEVDGRPG
eukprot:7002070-Pyramimonas_sp.AAC.1